MVDDALFETDLLTKLRHRSVLLFSRMAKKDRRIAVVSHAEDLFDLRQEPSFVVEKIMAVLERVGPRQRLCVCIGSAVLSQAMGLPPTIESVLADVLLGIQSAMTPAFSILADHAGSIFERNPG